LAFSTQEANNMVVDDAYLTVAGPAQAEQIIERSRFITSVQRVADAESALAWIESIRKRYWDATHNCWAFRVGWPVCAQRCSDDGEPSGTAGRPILEVLERQHLTNVAVVVTRYFGGKKLGASGLVRAYASCTQAGLEAARRVWCRRCVRTSFELGYAEWGAVKHWLTKQGIDVVDVQYTDHVRVTALFPVREAERLRANLDRMGVIAQSWTALGEEWADTPCP